MGYAEALIRARLAMNASIDAVARRVLALLAKHRDSILHEIGQTSGLRRTDLERTLDALDAIYIRLARDLSAAVDTQRTVTASAVRAAWDAAASVRRPGRLVLPQALRASVYAVVRDGVDFRTAARQHMHAASLEIRTLVEDAIANRVPPPKLARAIARYVEGSDSLRQATAGLRTGDDLAWVFNERRIPPGLRGAAARVRYNSTRIAFTEIVIARAETEALFFRADPLTRAVRWVVAANRGKTRVPDICDVLATINAYGLGRGVWPIDRIPTVPHPFCRCDRVPVTQNKPAPRPLGRDIGRKPVQLDNIPGFTDHPPGVQRNIIKQFDDTMNAAELFDSFSEGTV